MDLVNLREQLRHSLESREPVIAVVVVIGSTEENAVDPLVEVLAIREEFRAAGMNFAIHADAAWGGYFASILRSDAEMSDINFGLDAVAPELLAEVPTVGLKKYVRDQLHALSHVDSITIDPHKSGYVPYPAGGLCYRNSGMRDMVSLKSPVVFHSNSEPTVGIYGVEGSKPGAAAAAVFLSHKVIRPTKTGYGKILRQCLWTSRRMYCRLATLHDTEIKLVCLQRLPAEREGKCLQDIEEQKQYIRSNFVHRKNEDLKDFLTRDRKAAELFNQLGSDGVILTFTLNFYDVRAGAWNRDINKLNDFNQRIFERCSMTKPPSSFEELNKLPLILTSSSFSASTYKEHFLRNYCERLGVDFVENCEVLFLISTAMDPWSTETSQGDFLEEVEQIIREVAHSSLP
jgi:hypothetical protein